MAENAGVGISYVEDENGKLIKRRASAQRRTSARRKSPTARKTPANGIDGDIPYLRNEKGELVPYYGIQYVKDANSKLVPDVPPPRRFTEEDRERANRNRVRFTRASWLKRLLAIAEGKETATEQQYQAHIAYGRSKGWLRPTSKR